jgi:hypothetical protein
MNPRYCHSGPDRNRMGKNPSHFVFACTGAFTLTVHKRPGAPSIAPLRWVGLRTVTQPPGRCLCRCLFSLTRTQNRHFDRSCSRICEQCSGEIRFSTSTLRQPKPSFALVFRFPPPTPGCPIHRASAMGGNVNSQPASGRCLCRCPFSLTRTQQPSFRPKLLAHLRAAQWRNPLLYLEPLAVRQRSETRVTPEKHPSRITSKHYAHSYSNAPE